MAMAVAAQRALQSVASFPSCAQVGSDSSSSSSSCMTFRPSTSSSSSLRSAWTAQEFSGGIVKRSSSWERRQLGGRRGSLLGCRASFGGSTGEVWSTKASSSFCEFIGLASFGPISLPSCYPSTSARRVALNAPLRIEAREPTRKESVKVRHRRIRKKLNGTAERPRLAVFRSNQHLYAQVIDDTKQHTLASSSTLKKSMREDLQMSAGPTIECARRVGEEIAKVCLEKGITKVAFDRGGFVYHGRIQALADAAREGGLDF
ncbi:unnamed protein product [Calypogeia fissa]